MHFCNDLISLCPLGFAVLLNQVPRCKMNAVGGRQNGDELLLLAPVVQNCHLRRARGPKLLADRAIPDSYGNSSLATTPPQQHQQEDSSTMSKLIMHLSRSKQRKCYNQHTTNSADHLSLGEAKN